MSPRKLLKLQPIWEEPVVCCDVFGNDNGCFFLRLKNKVRFLDYKIADF